MILPTTCGTGSEVTNIAIVNRTRKGTKMGLVSPAMYADHAVLVPEFMKSLPWNVFATSSIDALIHAIESYLSPNATEFTELFSEAAIDKILRGYSRIAKDGRQVRSEDDEEYLKAATGRESPSATRDVRLSMRSATRSGLNITYRTAKATISF